MPAQPASLLATRRGKLLLLLLCAVQFLDVVDSSMAPPDLDAAVALAARIPAARFGGTVEVRPMMER